MEFLVYSLPEEIAREEALGNFSTALKLIDEFLKKDLPELQRKRLIYEKERIERLIEDYPFSEKEALEKLKEMFEDFSEEEFHRLLKEGILDYIVVNGERRFERRFFHNLAFAKPEYRERLRKKDEKVEKARKILHDRLERLTKGEKPKEYLVRARVTLRLKKTASVPERGFSDRKRETSENKPQELLPGTERCSTENDILRRKRLRLFRGVRVHREGVDKPC